MASHIAALLLYGTLTLTLTWPLATQLGEVVPHDLGDPLLTTWTLWWNAQVTPFTAPWWDGLAFYPARNTLALSDHRVGIGLVTTPLIWSGVSPLAAYNVAFLASFLLSAIAAYALCFALTGRATAAFVGGLVYGFNPFRAEHLPHLELLASYWLPVVFLALHKWVQSRESKWAAILAAAMTLQAFTSGYYFFYAGVLVGLWLLWFLPRRAPARQYGLTAVALLIPLAVTAPVLLTYRDAHAQMGLARSIVEIEAFSADLIGLVTAPDLLALWNSPREWLRAEGAIFPGLTAVILVSAGVMAAARQKHSPIVPRWRLVRSAFAAAGAAMTVVALLPRVLGPLDFTLLRIPVSISAAYKPFTAAVVFFALWVLTGERMRRAWRQQSMFAFYVLATVAMWMLALGPTARFLGERILYKAPYSWLMMLPGFQDGFRAPARFAMIAALTLSVAAAIAISRLLAARRPGAQVAAITLVALAICAESWIEPLPLIPAPEHLMIPSTVPGDAAIAELPFGGFEDPVAMYHSIAHRRPTVNGSSGYDPPHHSVLRAAMNDGAYEALAAVATARDVAIFVPRHRGDDAMRERLTARARAQPVAATATHDVYLLPRNIAPPPPSRTPELRIHTLTASERADDLNRVLDEDRVTAWVSQGPQQGDEWVLADLGGGDDVSAVVLESGGHTVGFPRLLAIDVSMDGASWTRVWSGATATLAVSAALHDPLRIPLTISFTPVRTKHIRVAQLGQSPDPWAVARLVIVGTAVARPPL